MPKSPDQFLDNIDFAAREIADAPIEERPLMLEGIAKALTRRLLQDEPGISAREVSDRVRRFVSAVLRKAEKETGGPRSGSP
jgi:hypothetical protein